MNKRAPNRHSSASSSGSEHTSDSSSQDSADRQRRKSSKGKRTKSDKAAKQGKTKGSKRGKDKRNRSSKDKRKKMHKRSKEKGPVQLSKVSVCLAAKQLLFLAHVCLDSAHLQLRGTVERPLGFQLCLL